MNASNAARAAQAPKSSLRITAKGCSAVAFVGTREHRGIPRPYAVVFTGRARKPHTCSGLYRTAEARDSAVAEAFAAQQAREEATKARREAAKAARRNHKIAVGAVLVASWGYDQTNVDAYEAVKVAGTMITLRKIATRTVSSDRGYSRVIPCPGSYTGGEFRCRVGNSGESVKITESARAYIWDGERSFYATASGFGH